MRNILGEEYDEIMTERMKKFNHCSDEKRIEEENKRIFEEEKQKIIN